MDTAQSLPDCTTHTLQPACALHTEPGKTKIGPFEWSAKSRKAAALVAADELTDRQLARRLKVARNTLYGWKRNPEFAARVAAIRDQLGQLAERYTIGRRAARLQKLQDLESRLWFVVRERADAMRDEAAGGGSGLLVRTVKQIGSGESAHEVDEYAVDVALSRELRAIYKQAAVETGQRADAKRDDASTGAEQVMQAVARAVLERLMQGNAHEPPRPAPVAIQSVAPGTAGSAGQCLETSSGL